MAVYRALRLLLMLQVSLSIVSAVFLTVFTATHERLSKGQELLEEVQVGARAGVSVGGRVRVRVWARVGTRCFSRKDMTGLY